MMRGTPLKRSKPMPRTNLSKAGALKGENSGAAERPLMQRKAVAPARKTPRDTGPDARTRQMVIDREGSMCASCGTNLPAGSWRSIQHRVARGVGGTNEIWNLILLCGSATSPGCHLQAEKRTAEMNAKGYYLKPHQDPRLEPVMLFSAHGSGITAWLAGDGTYSFDGPGVTA